MPGLQPQLIVFCVCMTISSSPEPRKTELSKGETGWGSLSRCLVRGENIESGASVVLASPSQ